MVPAEFTFHKISADEIRTNPFLSRQLIAYIGNKRALLPFIHAIFAELASEYDYVRFIDPFAGSGSVSRLAKAMGFEVHAGDWEFYSWVVTAAHVAIDLRRVDSLLPGGLPKTIGELNALGEAAAARGERRNDYGRGDENQGGEPPGATLRASGDRGESFQYISRYFAPRSTEQADYRTERLFYTRENGLFLDAVRSEIEARYPGWNLAPDDREAKLLLTASLLVEAATHANTSGVFKAFHKGFGGHGKDALGRILSPMRLEVPVLIDGRYPCTAACGEAADIVSSMPADIVYLDPPYTIHQYGSNYFMLNTVARWDCPPVSMERDKRGTFVQKAAIRADWTRTRSGFCYAKSASFEFSKLLDAIDARYIAVSYNTDGLVSVEELSELLSKRGRIRIVGSDYVTYRGGKQSPSRRAANSEFVVIVDTTARTRPDDVRGVQREVLRRSVASLMRSSFVPARLHEQFEMVDSQVPLPGEGGDAPSGGSLVLDGTNRATDLLPIIVRTGTGRSGIGESEAKRIDIDTYLSSLSELTLKDLQLRFSRCVCRDNLEEIEVLFEMIGANPTGRDTMGSDTSGRNTMARLNRLLVLAKKFAFKKYREPFSVLVSRMEQLIPDLVARGTRQTRIERFSTGLARLKEQARRRFDG